VIQTEISKFEVFQNYKHQQRNIHKLLLSNHFSSKRRNKYWLNAQMPLDCPFIRDRTYHALSISVTEIQEIENTTHLHWYKSILPCNKKFLRNKKNTQTSPNKNKNLTTPSGQFQNLIEKQKTYHTVRTVPKYNRKTKNLPHRQDSSKI
jgi:hypothetical protein